MESYLPELTLATVEEPPGLTSVALSFALTARQEVTAEALSRLLRVFWNDMCIERHSDQEKLPE
jgi:hypothetical protein